MQHLHIPCQASLHQTCHEYSHHTQPCANVHKDEAACAATERAAADNPITLNMRLTFTHQTSTAATRVSCIQLHYSSSTCCMTTPLRWLWRMQFPRAHLPKTCLQTRRSETWGCLKVMRMDMVCTGQDRGPVGAMCVLMITPCLLRNVPASALCKYHSNNSKVQHNF